MAVCLVQGPRRVVLQHDGLISITMRGSMENCACGHGTVRWVGPGGCWVHREGASVMLRQGLLLSSTLPLTVLALHVAHVQLQETHHHDEAAHQTDIRPAKIVAHIVTALVKTILHLFDAIAIVLSLIHI